MPISRDGTEYVLRSTWMVLKRLTGTRTSRHSPSGAAGSGRSASRSSSPARLAGQVALA